LRSDSAKLLELSKEVLDQVTRLVEMAVELAGGAAIGLWWDNRGLACCCQWLDDPLVGIERFIGNQSIGLHVRQQVICTNQVVSLAAGQVEADRIPERVDHGMDLGAQSPA
jgi:hypothetical protein